MFKLDLLTRSSRHCQSTMLPARGAACALAVLLCTARPVLTLNHEDAAAGSGAADAAAGFVGVVKDDQGVWWLEHGGRRFFSTGVSNVNNGGLDDGVGGVLSTPCQQQEDTALCGDTNNWDMVRHYAPYYNITQVKKVTGRPTAARCVPLAVTSTPPCSRCCRVGCRAGCAHASTPSGGAVLAAT